MRIRYNSKEELVEDVKTIGQMIIDKADEIVGDMSEVHHYTITATIGVDEIPQIIWTKEANALRIKTNAKEY